MQFKFEQQYYLGEIQLVNEDEYVEDWGEKVEVITEFYLLLKQGHYASVRLNFNDIDALITELNKVKELNKEKNQIL